ncbi:LolA family protein [Piscirickettsia salmonis]|uniref:LolA family protein n=1 Tax=Piscirickettsia salmonis TaxID=1238 RepID=UPI0007C96928|nr:Outer-membrane lipoprotein carrier protein precursor [Piscirickettsiaceae bacterium NZ-RLO1]
MFKIKQLFIQGVLFLLCYAMAITVSVAENSTNNHRNADHNSDFVAAANSHLVEFLKAAKTYQADFWQIGEAAAGRLECAYGRLLLKQPGQLLWQVKNIDCQQVQAFKAPADQQWDQIILTKQQSVKIYQPLLEQVIERSLGSLDDAVPVKLLTGASVQALAGFDVREQSKSADQSQLFILSPKNKQSLVSKIEIAFKNKELQKMTVLTPLGQSTKLQFFNIKINQILPSSLFELKLPKEVDIVKQG